MKRPQQENNQISAPKPVPGNLGSHYEGVAILTRAPRTPNPPGTPVFIYLSLFSKNETGIPALAP